MFVRDSSRMRTKSLRIDSSVSCSTIRVPVGPPAKPGRDHGLAERLERARDVDALAAGHRALLDGAVAAPEPEVRHRERLVDRRVEGDGDDHAMPVRCARRRRTARRRSNTSSRLPSASDGQHHHEQRRGRRSRRTRWRERSPRRPRARVTTRQPRDVCRASARSSVPTRAPAGSGPSSSRGHARPAAGVTRSPRRTTRRTVRVATSCGPRRRGGRARRVPTALAVADGGDPVVAREAVAQQRERVGVARRLARVAEHGAETTVTPSAGGRADEHVAGLLRVPGLDAVDDGHRARRAGCG